MGGNRRDYLGREVGRGDRALVRGVAPRPDQGHVGGNRRDHPDRAAVVAPQPVQQAQQRAPLPNLSASTTVSCYRTAWFISLPVRSARDGDPGGQFLSMAAIAQTFY